MNLQFKNIFAIKYKKNNFVCCVVTTIRRDAILWKKLQYECESLDLLWASADRLFGNFDINTINCVCQSKVRDKLAQGLIAVLKTFPGLVESFI